MITSISNKEIIDISKLHLKKYRDKSNLFLIEGTKIINEAFANNIIPEKIYFTQNFNNELLLNLKNKNLIEVSNSVFKKLSSQKNPEGVIAVINKNSLSFTSKNSKLILLDNIRDPGNLGTIIRTADAAGFNKIYLSNSCTDVFNDKTIRGSMGSLFHIPIKSNCNLINLINELKSTDYEVIGTSLLGENLYMNEIDVPKKFALIFGNESHGITSNLQQLCTQLYKLPLFGKAESLNVSVASGIFMYAFVDQKLR